MSTSDASTELAGGRGGARRAVQGADDREDAGKAPLADSLGPRLGPAVTFATTEHFNLQTAHALTVSEANGRASIYLAALSGNLIALAFVGQMSRLGAAFYAFALILLPVLAFVGIVTFVRLVQSSIEDLESNRIARLRSFYLQVAPELEPYLVAVLGTRSAAPLPPSAWQLTLTAAGMVAVINSVVVAACAGLVLEAAGVHSLAIPIALGAVIGAAAFTLHERHHRRARDADWKPRGCRSGRDLRPTIATGRRGVKEHSLCRPSHVAFKVTARSVDRRASRRASRSSTTSPADGDRRAAVSLAGTRGDRASAR